MQEKGLPAYLAELIGTLFLVFFITSVVVLFVSTGSQAQFGSDFAVVGFAQGLVLLAMIAIFGGVSGGHFNPAVTLAVAVIRKISPLDAVIYILAQLSGAVLGALLTKSLLLDEGRATHYGAGSISPMLSGNVAGAAVEGLGVLVLVMVILATVFSKKNLKDWAPLGIGFTFVFMIMVGGPLTGGCFNPARWFGAALVSNEWGGVWPYLVGPLVGAIVAVGVWRFVIEPGSNPAPAKSQPAQTSAAAK
ncbi:MAG: aquaporin family protein [Actinobacteria bacterium]|nr:aquaporin family protein [Actinomycetota bacterium]